MTLRITYRKPNQTNLLNLDSLMTVFNNATAAPQLMKPPRISLIDVIRGLAVIAMTIFHFSWDLENFGYAHHGMTTEFAWKLLARGTASSFLFIAGFSLFLSHGQSIRWPAFWRRFSIIAAAAAIITIATYFATPERFVFFGILHQMAFGSLIALAFLALPWPVTLIASLGFLFANQYLRNEVFDHVIFWWTGLGSFDPPANDFVPVFPWTAAILAGVAIAKAFTNTGLIPRLAAINATANPVGKALAWLGNHSLPYYLIHQPVLFGLIWCATQVAPPDRTAGYLPACVQSCTPQRDAKFCESFCGCDKTSLESKGIFLEVLDGKRDVSTDPDVVSIAEQCTVSADGG